MIQPIGDRVAVQKDPQPPLVVGGILIPECAERTPRWAPTILGTVLGVGPRVKSLKPNDRVALKSYAGDEWYIDNQQITIIRERDIVGLAHE